MAAAIRNFRDSDSERRYFLGNRLISKTHSEYVKDYAYSNSHIEDYSAGMVVYVECPSRGSKEMGIITKYTRWRRDDSGEYNDWTETVISTSLLTLKIDSRNKNNPTVSGTVISESLPFTIYLDRKATWTPLECNIVDFYNDNPDGYNGTIHASLAFYKDDHPWVSPTMVDMRIDYYRPGVETGSGTIRVKGTPDYDGMVYGTTTTSTRGEVVPMAVWGDITGVWNGVSKTISVTYEIPY